MTAVPLRDRQPNAAVHATQTTVFVRALTVAAEIGVYDHEHGRRQPLVVDVELCLAPGKIEHIADTVDYETVVKRAQEVAASGHFKLVETFAERLATALLEDSRLFRVRIRIEKPEALAPHAAAAGVELVLERG